MRFKNTGAPLGSNTDTRIRDLKTNSGKMLHKERIKGAFLYPKIVISVIGVTMLVIITYVIPQFAKLYKKFNAELPLATRFLIGLSNFVQEYWWVAVLVVPLAVYGLKKFIQQDKVKLYLHEKYVKIPVFGNLLLKGELSYFCTTFALLVRAGINVLEATQMAIDGIKNVYMRNKLQLIIPTVEQGGSIREAMDKIEFIPPLLASVVAVGEKTGTLDQLLDRVASLYDNETDLMLKKLPTLMEPLILVCLFGLVLFIALAVYLPMWKMSSLVRK